MTVFSKLTTRAKVLTAISLTLLVTSSAALATYHYHVEQAIERGKERALRDSELGLYLPDDFDSSQAEQFIAEQEERTEE